MGRIFLTSDWHFNHNKPFLYEPRGFSSIYEMNNAIITNHNALVAPDDDVYCLGDCMLGDNELGLRCIKELKGNIHIILGNHDTNTRIELYNNCYNIVEITYATVLKYNGYRFYLSHYPALTANADDDGKPLNKKTISLCGHTHTQDKWCDWDKGLIYHVELDAHECKPVLLDNIITDLNEKYYVEKR